MEYGHFFSGIGTKTTILQRPDRVVPEEEPEISELLKKEMGQRMEIYTGFEVIEAKQEGQVKTLVARNRQDGSLHEFSAEAVMIATGRVSNADILKPEKTGVKLDEHNFIKVNEYLGNQQKKHLGFRRRHRHSNVQACSQLRGRHRVAQLRSRPQSQNGFFSGASRSFYSSTSCQRRLNRSKKLNSKNTKSWLEIALYRDTAMGAAMGFPEGFVKVIVEEETGKILGAHIIGPEASILIQEIINAMVSETGTFAPIAQGMHIHPALSEVVQNAFGNLRPRMNLSKSIFSLTSTKKLYFPKANF